MTSLTISLSAVELLRALKTIYPYSVLSAKTGLSKPVLCRYVKGANLPSAGTALMLNRSLLEIAEFKQIVSKRLKIDSEGYVDAAAVSCDPVVLDWAGSEIRARYGSKHFTKIMTAATDGIPLATSASLRLGLPLLIAKRNKEVGIKSYVEESYLSSSPASVTTLYVPKGAISPGEKILIVDNITRTGRTLNLLLNIVRRAKATVPNAYILIAVGDGWRRTLGGSEGTSFEVLLKVASTTEKRTEKMLA
jgi:adenine/guanine phosphoribosyltransferase-like PRPP-binding protein